MNDIGPAFIAVTQGINVFNTLMPPLDDIRVSDPSDMHMSQSVRTAEWAGTVITLSLGILASALSNSSAPFVIALIIVGVLVFIYERTLRLKGQA